MIHSHILWKFVINATFVTQMENYEFETVWRDLILYIEKLNFPACQISCKLIWIVPDAWK